MLERLYAAFGRNGSASSSLSLETNRLYNRNGDNQGSTAESSTIADGAHSNPVEQSSLSQQLQPVSLTDIPSLPPAIPLPAITSTSLPAIPETKQVSSLASIRDLKPEKDKTQTSSTSTSLLTRQSTVPKSSKASSSVNESNDCIQEVEKRGMRTPTYPILTERWAVACRIYNM